MHDAYIVLLSKGTSSPFIQKDAEVAVSNATPKGGDERPADEKEVVDTLSVKFDPDGITDRIARLSLSPFYYSNFYLDGNGVHYWGRDGTKMYNLTSQEKESTADGTSTDVTYNNEKAFFFEGHQIYVINLPSDRAELTAPVDLGNMKTTIDYPKKWARIFDEAWRVYRNGFYQEGIHGVGWKVIKERYTVLLPYIKTCLDLNCIVGEMVGELNRGHTYINPEETEQPKRIDISLLGAKITRDGSGFFRLEKIFPGASWSKGLCSSLTEPGVDVKTGEYIVATDGIPTNTVKDVHPSLVDKVKIPAETSLNAKPQLPGVREVVISPLTSEYPLIHYSWIQDDIKKVNRASNRRTGYVHILDIGPGGSNEFTHYFYPQLDKEGLIIDGRANDGGNVLPTILERLSHEPYRLTIGRDTSHVGTVLDAVQTGPKACLVNRYSTLDGDLSPQDFRTFGLGKLVGTHTWRGIVGISGSLLYMDETDIRVPSLTSYNPKTGQWIIENHGVDPDILADSDSVKEWDEEDRQLNRAIEEAMKQPQDYKPLAPVPAPGDFSK